MSVGSWGESADSPHTCRLCDSLNRKDPVCLRCCLHCCLPHWSPLCLSTGRYILVTPRVLRVGSPENIHVQAHSDSSQPLSGTLQVNLTVWDFPMKKTVVARSQLTLSSENHFMDQTPVVVGDRPAGVATKGGSGPAARVERKSKISLVWAPRRAMISPHATSGLINKRRPLLVAWRAEHGLHCISTWLKVLVQQPTAQPHRATYSERQRAPIQLLLPASTPALCAQGWKPQQGLSSGGVSPQVPESLVFPTRPGQQHVTIQAAWAPTSTSSSMEKVVLVAPHAGYIFIQTDKTIYTPDHFGTATGHLAWGRR